MAERITINTTVLGIPLRREVIKGRKVVRHDKQKLQGRKGTVDEFKTVVFGQSASVVVEHYSELAFAPLGLCHRSEVSLESVKLKSKIPFVKRKLVKKTVAH